MKKVVLTYNLNRNNSEFESEYDIPLTIEALKESIGKKYNCVPIECGRDVQKWIEKLSNEKPDIVFNVAEGYSGVSREAFFPSLFEQLGYLYTGPGAIETSVFQDKSLTKRLTESLRIKMPKSFLICRENDLDSINVEAMEYPFIVKLNAEGSSIGMDENCIVYNCKKMNEQVKKLLKNYKRDVMVEKYIQGRDISMTYIEGIGIMGAVEYKYPVEDIYTFTLKTSENHTVGVEAVELPTKTKTEFESITQKIINHFGVKGYCRIDFRLDDNNNPFLLEINGQVSFHPDGAFIVSGREKGLDFDGIVHHIIEHTLNR